MHISKPKRVRIGPKSAYRFLILKLEILDIHECNIIESRNAIFFEDIFSYQRREVSL